MAENKTQQTAASVADFIAALPDETRRADARALVAMMERVTGDPAAMWGSSIIGFGTYRYRYDSGREGEMCRLGFSPRKAEQVLYVLSQTSEDEALLARLGKHRTGKGCLYVKKLADVDAGVLEELLVARSALIEARYPR